MEIKVRRDEGKEDIRDEDTKEIIARGISACVFWIVNLMYRDVINYIHSATFHALGLPVHH
jgi:hypothetical protein